MHMLFFIPLTSFLNPLFSFSPTPPPQTLPFCFLHLSFILLFSYILWFLCKRNNVVFNFLCLSCFTSHYDLMFHPISCKWHDFIPYDWVIFHCVYEPHFPYSSDDGHLGCFPSLAIESYAAINTGIHISLYNDVFNSFRNILKRIYLGQMEFLLKILTTFFTELTKIL